MFVDLYMYICICIYIYMFIQIYRMHIHYIARRYITSHQFNILLYITLRYTTVQYTRLHVKTLHRIPGPCLYPQKGIWSQIMGT